MSLILRQLLRDPLVVSRPISRALRRRRHDDWFSSLDPWAPIKRRPLAPSGYEAAHPVAWMDQMNREMAHAMNRMADDLEALDELVERTSMELDSPRRVRSNNETIVRRTESGGLQLALDVEGFKPEELKIKLVEDNLVVEASSESSGQDSYQRSQFKRWFKLPEDCNLEEIKSKLTSDNKLLIELPSTKPIEDSKARSIPIEVENSETTAAKNTSRLEAANSEKESSSSERRQAAASN